MGNSACLTASQLSAVSDSELGRTHEQDELCLSLFQQQLPTSEIVKVSQLDLYKVLGASPSLKTSSKPEVEELGFLCLQETPEKLPEKFAEVRTALQNEVRFLGSKEISPATRLKNARLQILCRVYDALLREEERERRSLASVKEEAKSSDKATKEKLPPLAKAGLSFGIGLLMQIVEVVGVDKPAIITGAIDLAASVVMDLKPMSLVTSEPSVERSIGAITGFFEKVLNGTVAGLAKGSEMKGITVMMGLALAKGNMTSALSLVQKLMSTATSPDWTAALPSLTPLLSSLQGLGVKGSRVHWNWFPTLQGPDIVLSNENLRITRTNSSGWGSQKSEQSVTEGVHYVELFLERNASTCLLIGITAASTVDFTNRASIANTVCYQADGDTYNNGVSSGNIGTYTANDRIGILINMEEHSVIFFKNGVKMSHDPFTAIPAEVQLIICFGGDSQFAVINNEAEIPQGFEDIIIGGAVSSPAIPSDSSPFPVLPSAIIQDPIFSVFTSSSGTATPSVTATYLLISLDAIAEGIFGAYNLDEIQHKYPKNKKIKRSNGLAVDVKPETFTYIIQILKKLKGDMERRNWATLTFRTTAWACLSALRLLRNHVFAALLLKLPESESGLTEEMKGEIKTILAYFSTLKLANLKIDQTPENEAARNALDRQSLLLTLHSFELFYPTFNDQLDFLLSGLVATDTDEGEQRLVTDVLKKVSLPSNLTKAFDTSAAENRSRMQKFLSLLLNLVTKGTLAWIGGGPEVSQDYSNTLFVAQSVLFIEIAKRGDSPDALSVCKSYLDSFFTSINQLLTKLKSKTSGRVIDTDESLARSSILGSHLITLLRTLCVIPLNPDFSSFLISEMTRLSGVLSDFSGGPSETTTGISQVETVYESEHPYPNSADQVYELKVPEAAHYTLVFDPQCRSESGYDYLELFTDASKSNKLYRWEGDTWPREPLVINQQCLYFTFHSDGGTNYWGWKITISAAVAVTIEKESWVDEVRNSAALVLVALCQNLIMGKRDPPDKTVNSVLTNKLIRGGVKDTVIYRLLKTKPMVNRTLAELIASTQTEEKLPANKSAAGLLKLSIFKSLLPKRVTNKANLSSYLTQLGTADTVSSQYCDIPIIDELIKGSERTITAFKDLKKRANIAGPMYNLGGSEMDQAERALFGVLIAFFELTNAFTAIVDEPMDVCEAFKFLLKQVATVRQWAQLQRQKLIDSTSRDVPYSELGKDVVDKCVILLHTDYKQTLSEIGIEKVLQSLMVSLKRTQTGDEKKISLSGKMKGSKWKDVKKSVEALGRVKTLQGLLVLRNTDPGHPEEEDKKQLLRVFSLIMDIMSASLPATQLAMELEKRRNRATARCIGLNLLSMAFRAAPESSKGELQGLISAAFSSAFMVENAKKHYSECTEGTDPYLVSCLQRSFFQLYQLLLNRVQLSAVRDLDCTSEPVFKYMLSTFDALSFPFDDQDAALLLDLRMREPAQFLLSWSKGQKFCEKLPKVLDRSKIIVDFKVHLESDYHASADHEAFSLHTVNRLDGEVTEDVEGQLKLALEVVRGSADANLNPIVDIQVASSDSTLEGYTKIDGNINEVGDSLSLFIKRDEVREDGSYLTKVKVTGWCPVTLGFTYKPYASLMAVDNSSEDCKKRSERKQGLKRGAWLLFKLLMYSAAGKSEDQLSLTRQNRRTKLQELYAELLYPELKCLPRQIETEDSLDLRKLLSGKNWRESEVPLIELKTNPVAEWIEKIKEDANEYFITATEAGERTGLSEVSLSDVVNDYVSSTDPMMKGALKDEEIPEGVVEIPEEYRNSKREVDFFCFLTHVMAHADTVITAFWLKNLKQSPLFQNVPKDFYEAQTRLGEGSVASILSVFQSTIHPNEVESFTNYLQWFSEAETPGVLPKENAPKSSPKEFLNDEKNLDFFSALKAIREHPEQFPDYFRELKPLLQNYDALPASCSEFYKARLSPSQAEYQASLLLLLYQCCNSKGMLSILAQPHMLIELLKHMLVGSLKASTIAFRIVREIVLSEHSPESFDGIWTSLPKGKLRAEFGSEVCKDLILVLLCFVGIHCAVHIKSWKFTFLTLEKIEILSHESLSFLHRISKSDRWREKIASMCLNHISQAMVNVPTETGSEVVVGALGYLRSFGERSLRSLHEWTKVRLQGAGVSEGILVKLKRTDEKMKLYCEGDDALHTESVEFFVDTVSDRPISLFDELPSKLVESVFATLIRLTPLLDDPIYNMQATTAESRLNNAAVRRLVQSSALEVLATICECRYDLNVGGVGEFVGGMIKGLGREPQAELSYPLYEELRKLMYTRHRTKVASQVKSNTSEMIGEHAEAKIVREYSEEKQILVATLKSIGLQFADIKEAIDHGCSDTDSVLKFIEQRAMSQKEKEATTADNMLLYKLTRNDKSPPIFRDSSGKASFSETPKGHLCLQAPKGPSGEDLDEPKYLWKLFDEGVFGSLENPPDELTLLAAVGFTDKPEECTFGFVIGKISLTLKVPKEKVDNGAAERNYFFRAFLQFNGHSVVFNEATGDKVLESDDAFSFEDIATTKFGVFLNTCGKVELKGLALFLGHFTGTPSYWEEETDTPPQAPGRLVAYRTSPVNQTVKALTCALGVPSATAIHIARKYPDLKRAISYLISEPVAVESLTTDFGTYIEDVVTADSKDGIPPGYDLAQFYSQNTTMSDYTGYSGLFVGVKTTLEKGAVFVKGLEWVDDHVSVLKEEKGTGAGVVSILILKPTNPMSVDLPAGYQIVCSEGLAVNLTPDTGKFHFLAFRTNFTVRGHPFVDLPQMPKKMSDEGLSDSFPSLAAAANVSAEAKTIAEELVKYSAQSSVQLQTKVFAIEKAFRSQAAFKLILKLMHRWSDSVQDIRQLSHLLECSGKKFSLLEAPINAILERGEMAPVLANVLLVDVIAQLIKPAFATATGTLRSKTLYFESPHPYENNTDKTDEIRIPGAKKMILTFDPLCKSEANYDYLQFAKDKDFQAEICKYSGSSWPNFEYEGDTLYFKFHSDGSNNDWGYKFMVTSTVSVSESSGQDDVLRALWLLETIVFSRPILPGFFNKFLDREMQNALNLFAHTATDADQGLRALFLLKRLLVTAVESNPDTQSIVALLAQETFALYKNEAAKPDKSQLLKHIVGLMVEIKDRHEFTAGPEWFEGFYETYSFLRGIETKDENFQFVMLKQFLDLKGRSLDVTRESSHPYSPSFSSKEVYSRGASCLSIQFTKESEAEPCHGMLFSKDLPGLQPIIISGGQSSTSQEVYWSTNPAGPDIATSNNNKTVTRTNSSGWGNAILTESFSSGKMRLNFKVDSHDGSSYLYIGVWAVGSYPLTSCIYKDLDYPLWSYKVTGEFHRKGFSVENSAHAYSTGDEIGIALDFDEKTVTFFKNNEQKHQFTDLVGPVTGCACFGGSNQNISLISVNADVPDPTMLSELQATIPGDRFFYHYPVNAGYLGLLNAAWRSDRSLSFANGNKTVTKAPGGSEATTVLSSVVLRGGKQFLEIKISALTSPTGFSFGIGLIDQPNLSIAYQSDGVLKKFGESFICESYSRGDVIALLVNTLTSELKVYKNGAQVSSLPRVTLEAGKDFRWAVTIVDGGTVEIINNSALVETLDLMGKTSPAGTVSKYGYKFTVKPTFIGKNKKLAFENLGSLESDWKTYYAKHKAVYSKEVCEQLVNYVDEKSATTGKDPLSLTGEDLSPSPQELLHYDLLEKLTIDDIRGVFRFIKDLNERVNSALPLISLDLQETAATTTELQKMFLSLRSSLFLSRKRDKLKDFLSRTNSSERPTIEVNRTRATRQKEKGLVDSQGVSSIFGQIYRLMNKASNRSLRNEERIFQVNFTGEGAIDAGGPYNEVISNICEELQSKYLPLLVQCPNGVQNLGENRECWVPNPTSDSSLHLDLFQFLGKLFGVAVRTQNNLNLCLPPVFWKRLVFNEVGSGDVKSFDECIYQTLDILRHMTDQGITPDTFQSAFDGETFTTRDSGGRTVELIPGGKNMIVTYQNALEFAGLLEKQRLSEAAAVYSAIRTGMSAVVPLNLIYMFSWKQVETLVCGAADINVDVLKGNTIYEGLSADTPVVLLFWEVMREMTSKERSLFLRFVWGRSRLPSGKQFKQFKITSKSVSGNPDKYLPVSHTCFFTLDLPGYSNKEVLREKLLYAVTHCQAIDLDRVAGAEGWEDE